MHYKCRFIVVTFLLMLSAVSSAKNMTSSGVSARVGDSRITERDIAYRIAVERVYGNKRADRALVLASLTKDALNMEVGRKFGINVSRENLDALDSHAEKNSRAPEILSAVKQVFGKDKESYDRIYLSPKIISRKLRGWHSRNVEIHKAERAAIEKALALAISGKSMEETGKAAGLTYSMTDDIERKSKLSPLLQKYFPHNDKSYKNPFRAILESLSEGEVYSSIVEGDSRFMVVKLIEKNESRYKYEAVIANKVSFTEWFKEQADKVSIRIYTHGDLVSGFPSPLATRRTTPPL